MENRRVVITGTSAIAANAYKKDDLFEMLSAGNIFKEQIPVKFEKNYCFKSRWYVPFPNVIISDYGFHNKFSLAMEENAKLAIVCALQAVTDAGFDLVINEGGYKIQGALNIGAVIGTGLSSLQTAFNSYQQHSLDKEISQIVGTNRYNRMVIPLTMPNSIAAWISIMFGISGLCHTVNASCASGNHAIGDAFERIRSGRNDVMITGGVECLKDDYGAIMRGFDMLGALTQSADGKPEPFSERRSGFLFSEGAGAVLILEELNHAVKRKARIYAEIEDCYFNSDHHNIVQMDDSGESIKQLLHKASSIGKIDYINAHGTATVNNDQIEANAIKSVFGDIHTQPVINSTKSIIGHSIGASAAIEAVVVADAIFNNRINANISEKNIGNLNIAEKSISTTVNRAISASYGFGGHNSLLVFKRF